MIFNCIPDNIHLQMNVLYIIIPILMHFYAYLPLKIFVLSQIRALQATHHPMKCDIINVVYYFQQYIAGYTVINF